MATIELKDRLEPWIKRWSLGPLTGANPWFSNMASVTLEPNAMLLRAGDTTRTLYMLESGLVRLFYTTPDGKERNKAFFQQGQVTGAVSAAMTLSPAPFSIQALEPTTAISFQYSDLEQAAQDSPQIARVQLVLLSEAFIRNEQREAMLLTCNAQQRYEWLLQHEPELVQRVPQFHIATYLGVDAVSLSRIKRKSREQGRGLH